MSKIMIQYSKKAPFRNNKKGKNIVLTNLSSASNDKLESVYKENTSSSAQTLEAQITLWDIAKKMNVKNIKKALFSFGRVASISWVQRKKEKSAIVEFEFKNLEQQKRLEIVWSLPLENGKLTRISLGNYDLEIIKSQSTFKATLTELPKNAKNTSY
ncbi:hypothetical protein F8M41_012750 [Gigaspora margarita]|uniref:Uncharacterized protein n=1 Tax=Gigaspora margarita TaxID=4874 RepID=A0A8H3ZZR5_GIGMA|nr:hypothetical protein F8M41_012750 [Gigaspora margarita]